ncbi:MAG: DUF1080 domain-containing protein [Ferruginibacter sp.]|nr:DUF1080 domain-containing protein [Cytophagales bacterium]
MRFLKKVGYSTLLGLACCRPGYAQEPAGFTTIPLNDLRAFRDPGKNWIIASDASADYTVRGDMKPVKGTGAVVNHFSETNRTHLFTREEFGDLEVELDFMMANYSNSGVYLQGRYEIQLLDSWTRPNPTASDCGGIYSRWTKERGTFEGTPPAMNVARAPGLWQHLRIRFRAPRFNAKGEKRTNARFEAVHLNGVLVQQQSEVTGPTGSAMFRDDEKPTGPLVLQGDHGSVAFKNIRYRALPPASTTPYQARSHWETRNPILLKPAAKPYLLRSFVQFGEKKLTHVVSVGSPNGINFSYDSQQGALFQVWRGDFLDVTQMWFERGEPQLARPLGSVIRLSDAPAVAVLAGDRSGWPDSVAFDDLQSHGYVLNQQRMPTFSYAWKGLEVKDSLVASANGESLVRTLTVTNAPDHLFCRVVAASTIEAAGEGLYGVNGKSYYIRLDKKFKPVIRPSAQGTEIIVPLEKTTPLTYSIIW